ncbi:methyltransferase domain-containing protein [Ferroacidibacillus organovorans]|uniref:methyltransferase domain-containing protein n=1 Tax=Ferroacidibacillus organovorans TaxID=1765683 RepID=UPI001E44C560|nr:methyltransferase domain-containing protein [Ferroacidibacillus organovorans]
MRKDFRQSRWTRSDLQFPDGHFDGVWTINCLLHVPKRDLPGVLAEVRRVLKPGGLFYFGVYGGMDFEGVWEADRYDPKRFFSFHTDAAIQETVRRFFTLESFRTIDYGNEILHFQAMVLRR